MGKQEYMVDGESMIIVHEVKGDNDLVVLERGDGYGDYVVKSRKNLVKKEDSWQFKEAQKRADELRLITQKAEENFEKVAEKLIKTACSALSTRMKLNTIFSKGMEDNGWALIIANELHKLVREEAKDVIKKETRESSLS